MLPVLPSGQSRITANEEESSILKGMSVKTLQNKFNYNSFSCEFLIHGDFYFVRLSPIKLYNQPTCQPTNNREQVLVQNKTTLHYCLAVAPVSSAYSHWLLWARYVSVTGAVNREDCHTFSSIAHLPPLKLSDFWLCFLILKLES